jgi:hypothetical protein
MLKIESWFFACVALLLSTFAGSAHALSSDFKIQTELSVGAPVDAMAVSNDRFVIALDKSTKSLNILDTWDWTSPGTITLGNTVDNMAINQEGNILYFSMSTKNLGWMDISALQSLPFDGAITPSSFTMAPVTGGASYGATTISEIDVISAQDDPTVDCVFLKTRSISNAFNLASSIVQAGTSKKNDNFWYGNNLSSIALSASVNRFFAVTNSRTVPVNTNLDGYVCYSNLAGFGASVIPSKGLLTLLAPNQLLGLGAAQDGTQLVVGETVTKNMSLYSVSSPPGQGLMVFLEDTYAVNSTAAPIWFEQFASEPDPFVLFGQTANNLYLLPMIQSGFTTDSPSLVNTFTGSPLILANSSTTDGNIYVQPKSSSNVSLLTANPWVYDLTTTAPALITGDTFSIGFSFQDGSSYAIAICPSFALNAGQCRKTVARGPLTTSPASVVINASDVGGGDQVLGVFVADSRSPAHTGRSALPVSVALAPQINNFTLQFGNNKILISFGTGAVLASTVYTIYYGTNGDAPPDHPEQISNTGGDGTPPAPIVLASPAANHSYSYTVENLENGEVYYAQIVVTDVTGKVVVSERKSTIPEVTFTLTDLDGEKGGCGLGLTGKGRPANASDFILLALPLTILMLLKTKLRSRK